MASSVRLRRAGFAAVALASVFLLAACAPPTRAAESFPGEPVSHEAESEHVDEDVAENEGVEDGMPQAAWVGEGGKISVTLFGSSTCPPVGRDIRVLDTADAGNRVAIDLVERAENEICTMDLVPHTTLFWTPMSVTTTKPLIVEVDGASITVPVK